MTIEQIFTTYWSQTTLLLLSIGYIFKRFFDLRSRKTEINHNLFQQKRLESANNFFSNCATTERMWQDVPIYDIFERKMTSKEIDAYIFPHLNEVRRNVFELKIYFDSKEHKDFQLILKNMECINGKLSQQYFNYSEDVNTITKVNNFQKALDDVLRENKIIYDRITKCIRKTFN
jgi:hypothetical protein